ncbi:hypothetical protein [Actinoplanes missouriensis]|nr:hypothetical protein [Actinoplanes missouriensis]
MQANNHQNSPPKRLTWGACACGCPADRHDAVIVRPICIDPGNRVLFEGTLGACTNCGCSLYQSLRQAMNAAEGLIR